ncbi:MAG: hypothetical protein WCC10_08950 [Tumebacillaceae bacterium]
MTKAVVFFIALIIIFLALVSDGFTKRAVVWKTLFRIFQLAEATSAYKRR